MSTFGQDIMNIAVEGGIGYFAAITDSVRSKDLDWDQVTVVDTEGAIAGYEDSFEPVTVKATQMEKAARSMVRDEYNLNQEMKHAIRQALNTRDAGYLDAYDAQAIFQQAAFGEQVFG